MEYNTNFITMYKIGYQLYDIPDDVYDSIRSETDEMIANNFKNCEPYNVNLAGNLSKEYRLNKSIPLLNYYISVAAPVYFSNYNKKLSDKKHTLNVRDGLEDVWVNFQQKGEVNPIHNHSGDLSFVMYIKLPYTIEEERNHPSCYNSNSPVSGCLQFVYVDQYEPGGVATHTLYTDKQYEKKMIVFSSSLKHIVYPFFTTDEYRVSVAGNIKLNE